jgi:hypothetical protein
MKYAAFIHALGIPDGANAHTLFDAAVRDGVKTTAEARRIFRDTREADLVERVQVAQEIHDATGSVGLALSRATAPRRYALPELEGSPTSLVPSSTCPIAPRRRTGSRLEEDLLEQARRNVEESEPVSPSAPKQ